MTALILFIPTGLPFLVCGYFIACKKRTDLITGWDKERVHNPDTFATGFGWGLIVCAVVLFIAAFLFSAGLFGFVEFFAALVLVIIVALATGQYCLKKFGS